MGVTAHLALTFSKAGACDMPDNQPDLNRDLDAFEAQRASLEARYRGQWVVFHDAAFVDAFPTFEGAAEAAVARFGRGPYLIKQVGAPPVTIPASVMYNIAHA